MAALLDAFIAVPDIRERHATEVDAPADLVFEVARHFDMQSVPLVRSIFWLRGRLMRSQPRAARPPGALDPASLIAMGWGQLLEVPGRCFIAGAVCQPWRADVVFTPIPPEQFAAYAEPDQVKIAWTLEVEPLGTGRTRLATETRAAATDEQARTRFRRYWSLARVGIVGIRLLLLPAIRREAVRRWRAGNGIPPGGT